MPKIHLELSLACNRLYKNSGSELRPNQTLDDFLSLHKSQFPICKAGMIMTHLLGLLWGINEILNV